MRGLLLLFAAGCASAPREEVVDGLPLIHVPVDGTRLRPYAIAKFETTWKDFTPFTEADGVTRPSHVGNALVLAQCPPEMLAADHPLHSVRWHSAMAYCDWLSAKTGRKFRLPTHAEWEHAARAGEAGEPSDRGWGRSNAGARSRRPGMSKPNSWGIHDMLGNVWEPVLEGEYRGGAWDSREPELSFDRAWPPKPEWFASDPWRPRSLWWWTDGFCQGVRVACVGGVDAVKASEAYLSNVSLKILKQDPFAGRSQLRKVTVEARNGGERAIEELEVQVYFLDPRGRPHRVEVDGATPPGRPNYTWAYPVLSGTRPLGPGERRVFDVDVPETFDSPAEVNFDAFGAQATWVRF